MAEKASYSSSDEEAGASFHSGAQFSKPLSSGSPSSRHLSHGGKGRKSPKKPKSSSSAVGHSSPMLVIPKPASSGAAGSGSLKPTTSPSLGSSTSSGAGGAGVANQGKLPAQHRKSYDWLQPSSASASHSGPPERTKVILKNKGAKGKDKDPSGATDTLAVLDQPVDIEDFEMGSTFKADETQNAVAEETGDGSKNGMEVDPIDELMELTEKKKSHKKRPADAPPGPGKNWRKGLKKGVPRHSDLALGEVGSATGTPPPEGFMSREGSLEINDSRVLVPEPITVPIPRGSTPPFVLANSVTLGIPVFSKPISAPKITLGTFPKVTIVFAPQNGGDTGPFPRKEKVRSWRAAEKSVVGVGGGTLRFRSWQRELGRLIQADREAKELQRAVKKAAAANANLNQQQLLTDTNLTIPWERPPLTQTASFESDTKVTPEAKSAVDDGEEASEMGDDRDSVAGTTSGSPAVTAAAGKVGVGNKGKGGAKTGATKARAKPRKSKLAQEIVPTEEGIAEPSEIGVTEEA